MDEKPANDGKQNALPKNRHHDGPRLTGDPPEIAHRKFHPDDDHRQKDQDRHAGIDYELQQEISPVTRDAERLRSQLD